MRHWFSLLLFILPLAAFGIGSDYRSITPEIYLPEQLGFGRRDESTGAVVDALATTQTFIKLTATVTDIRGAVAPASPVSRMLVIVNYTGASVTIQHEVMAVTAANRFSLPDAANLIVPHRGSITFLYDHGQARWVMGGGGAVAAEDLSVGTGLAITAGTGTGATLKDVTIGIDAGYYLPTTGDQTDWDQAAADTQAATASNTVSTIVKRDGSGNFAAGTITAALSGNATTATALAADPANCSGVNFTVGIDASGVPTCADPFTGRDTDDLPEGANLYFTDERAQDAVGTIFVDSSTIDFDYVDLTPSITGIVIDNSISDAKIRQSAGLSVLGRSANSTGNIADITAASDFQIFRRSGTAIGFGSIDLSQSGAVGASVLGFANGGTGLSAVGTANYILGTNAAGTAFEWKAVTATAAGVLTAPGAIRSNTSLILEDPGAGTNIWTVQSPTLAGDFVLTLPVDDGTANQYLQTDGNGVTTWNTVTGGITQLTGDVTAGPGSGSQAATIANDAVTDAKLRNSAALSVIGRSANSTGDPADIAAGADHNIMRRSGTAIGFGAIDLSQSGAVGSSILPFGNGGTGLSALGTADQLFGTNSGASAFEHKAVTATAAGALTAPGILRSNTSLRLEDPGAGTNHWTFQSPTLAGDYTWTWPVDDGTTGYFLKTDGSGVTSWSAPVSDLTRFVGARFDIESGSTCPVNNEFGIDWINGTPNSPADGRCEITFNSGIFAAGVSPACVLISGNTAIRIPLQATYGTSTFEIRIYNTGSGLDPSPFNIICMGNAP